MRKFFYLLTLAVLFASCEKSDSSVTLTLSDASLSLRVGDMYTIETSGTAKNIEWTSSNEDVATVYYGVVTANAIGYTTITATSGKARAECIVYVTGTDGSSLRISPPVVTLRPGDEFDFSYGNTYDLDLTWESSASEIVTVDDKGHVKALVPGNAVITLSTIVESVSARVSVEHSWGEYQMVWSEEFDGTALDESVWSYNIGGSGWGNQEKQYYTDRSENIRVQNGMLEIEARKEDYLFNNNKDTCRYTSARIHSKGKKEFKYGKIESRIKFPGGKGTWPAFWMLGSTGNWPNCGEIDIIEHVGSMDKRASFAVHTALKNGTKGNNWSSTQWFDYDLSADFHVYAVEWAQEEKDGKDVIRFFMDNVQYAELWEEQVDNNDSWPFNRPEYIIYNFAIGGSMGGTVDDTIFDQQRIMYVDWVRVWQRSEK